MKPFFSIIIPYHNSKDTIGSLLDSIAVSKKVPLLEVIVVDDASLEVLQKTSFAKSDLAKLNVRIIRLSTNKGPGAARNRGAGVAKGKFLVFFDSDVVLFPDALHNLWQIYEDDPDIVAVTGVWVKHQRTKKFFPNFKALRDWSYWINERDKSGYYYLFSTRCASIKREVFQRLKGFDERYVSPLVEDIEFTYRVARRYAIIFAPNVRVHHEFEDFLPIAKKYFWRSYYWTKLYQSRKKFDPVATTLQEAATALSGIGVVGLTITTIVLWGTSQIFNPPVGGQFSLLRQGFGGQAIFNQISIFNFQLFSIILYSLFILLVIHLFLVRKFLAFVYQEKGVVFAVKSFFMGLVLYCFIAGGALWGKLDEHVMKNAR